MTLSTKVESDSSPFVYGSKAMRLATSGLILPSKGHVYWTSMGSRLLYRQFPLWLFSSSRPIRVSCSSLCSLNFLLSGFPMFGSQIQYGFSLVVRGLIAWARDCKPTLRVRCCENCGRYPRRSIHKVFVHCKHLHILNSNHILLGKHPTASVSLVWSSDFPHPPWRLCCQFCNASTVGPPSRRRTR